jgi:hypothetical protein
MARTSLDLSQSEAMPVSVAKWNSTFTAHQMHVTLRVVWEIVRYFVCNWRAVLIERRMRALVLQTWTLISFIFLCWLYSNIPFSKVLENNLWLRVEDEQQIVIMDS